MMTIEQLRKLREFETRMANECIGEAFLNPMYAKMKAQELGDRYILEIIERHDAGKGLTGWQAAALAEFIGYHISNISGGISRDRPGLLKGIRDLSRRASIHYLANNVYSFELRHDKKNLTFQLASFNTKNLRVSKKYHIFVL